MEITSYLTDCIKAQIPVAFLKYGDGEYLAASGSQGCNCDRDTYTEGLKNGLIKSFTYMVDHAPNTYVGIWNDDSHMEFWNKLIEKPVRVAKYHTIIMDNDHITEKVELFKTIKESSLKKIYICNPLLVRAKILLNIDHMVHVPFNNWFDNDFENILNKLKSLLNADEQFIILTSAGMGAKVLVGELSKIFPKNIYIDIGSGIDKICTKKTSRGWEPSYDDFMRFLTDIIPVGWESNEYQNIFDEAQSKLGVHL